MSVREDTEAEYARQTESLAEHEAFRALEAGTAPRAAYDAFLGDLCRTHLKSPQILAFLYSVAPPSVAEDIRHNMLEEMGLDDGEGVFHPGLLRTLATSAGRDERGIQELEALAQEDIRRLATDPILYGTMKELGLSVLLEVSSFEWMLSRTASRMAAFLERHRGLPRASLVWFSHHSEVDIRHAEEGLDAVAGYVEWYEIEAEHFRSILALTFRENVFVKRYFR